MEAALISKACAIHYQIYPRQYTSNHSHTTNLLRDTQTHYKLTGPVFPSELHSRHKEVMIA